MFFCKQIFARFFVFIGAKLNSLTAITLQ